MYNPLVVLALGPTSQHVNIYWGTTKYRTGPDWQSVTTRSSQTLNLILTLSLKNLQDINVETSSEHFSGYFDYHDSFGNVILFYYLFSIKLWATGGSGSINKTESVADITFDDLVKRNFITPKGSFLGQLLTKERGVSRTTNKNKAIEKHRGEACSWNHWYIGYYFDVPWVSWWLSTLTTQPLLLPKVDPIITIEMST